MPDLNTFKLEGTKLVPVNRFNLEPAKPSTAFTAVTMNKANDFKVIEHPIIHSIDIKPILVFPFVENYFPLIEGDKAINENDYFKDYFKNEITLFFPQVEIMPNNGTVFYYENVPDKLGNKGGLLGKVTLKYSIKEKPLQNNQKSIVLNLKEAILNLKVNLDFVKINGTVNTATQEIQFDLIDEAVKIAFLNLVSNLNDLKCNIDLFFDFKGYSKIKRNFLFARDISLLKSQNITKKDLTITKTAMQPKAVLINSPLMVRADLQTKVAPKTVISGIQLENSIKSNVQEEYVKSTFLLKVNKTLSYPIGADPTISLYKTIGGGFVNIPFNLNEDFSQFKQIFVTGFNFSKLSIYKSMVQPNTFLVISKVYSLSKDLNTMKPCISTIFHAFEDGAGTAEEISKISFQFAIGPNLSEFDLAKLKIALLQNNFLDGDTTDYFDKVQFLFPNDIGAEYEVSGNYFLQQSDISTDGKHFLFDLSTENLSEASIMINALNNTISQYANINFQHKEIKDSSIIELNIEKTIGEIIEATIDNLTKKIQIENQSISNCKLNSALLVYNQNATYINSVFFKTYPQLISNDTKLLEFLSLNPNSSGELKNVFFDFENIENISSEFSQIVSQSTAYNRYVQVQIKAQNASVNKITIELTVQETGSKFIIERLKSEFSTPILFNFIIKNTFVNNTLISYKVNYFDKNDNLIGSSNEVFDFSKSSKITINKKS
ncbi:hypothetical protein HNP37_003885 [Flavobacterium nitrogenifigens]|uniref:Uncharacterized protein n=2 Tax=Flavobacterium TaxID=237 RepID=A0A7W7J1J7_9FLAO|nr:MULTISPECIES: hypothetical protein [Flavobacterium]MBB4803805.1 hypothetical protein [Flavobacterium nitrogenifigens]MBB6389043.1 hypothetical protein [Flavobacterium notoginsengisoli]